MGTVFTLTTTGTGFALLHDFGDKLPRNGPTADGTSPGASLILDDAGFLYGTSRSEGGSAGLGTIFRLPIPDPLRADIAFVSKTDTPDPVLGWYGLSSRTPSFSSITDRGSPS